MTTVIGGGISGLSAAYYAINEARAGSVTLLEASSRLGGWIRSRSSPSGAIFEQGPRTIRPQGPSGRNTLHLIEDLQLSDRLIHVAWNHPAVRNRLIYSDKALHLLPMSLKGIFKKSSLLKQPLINYLWKEFLTPKGPFKEDESIYSFFQRRLDQEIADNVISPIICGICAGDAREISINFLFKSLLEMEQKNGSVIKGRLKELFRRVKGDEKAKEMKDVSDETSALVQRVRKEHWALWSLQDGLEQLPRALADDLTKRGVKIQTGKRCERLTFKSDRVELLVDGEVQECERVISSLSARQLAELLHQQHPTLSAELKAIPTVTVAVVNLEFPADVLSLKAFGCLIAPKENLPLLGIIFDSCVFPQKSSTVMTVMMGGAWFKKYFGPSPTEEQLLTTAIDGVKNILDITEIPLAHNVVVLKDCISQYVVGHVQRIKRIRDYIAAHNIPLSLCGSSYEGVGLNDVILSAKQAVHDIVK